MGDIKQLPNNPCIFCKKKEATRLCDRVTGSYNFAGHPPKVNGVISNKPMYGLYTCDAAMCEKCSTNIDGADYCPTCLKKIKAALGAK